MQFVFHTSSYDEAALLPEVQSALDKRMESYSRKRLPGLWKVIDRQNGSTQPNEMTRGRRIYRRVMSVLLILVGLFLLIPGLVRPKELFAPLLAGIWAVGTGIYFLWSTRKKRKASLEKRAQKLLSGMAAAPSTAIVFSVTGMILENQPEIPYQEITFYTETPSGFFLNWADQATFLQKKDLVEGEKAAFATFLQEKLG